MHIALVLGFWHDGRIGDPGTTAAARPISPGAANEALAHWTFERRHRFGLILTQTAVSQVWINEGNLRLHDADVLTEKGERPCQKSDNTAVFQMHRDEEGANIRTLGALRFAAGRLSDTPTRIVLVAHRDHIERARLDLECVWKGEAVCEAATAEYPASITPQQWNAREWKARIVERIQRVLRWYGTSNSVKLPPLPTRPPSGWDPKWCASCSRYLGLSPPSSCDSCGKPPQPSS